MMLRCIFIAAGLAIISSSSSSSIDSLSSSIKFRCQETTDLEITILTHGSLDFQEKIGNTIQNELITYLSTSIDIPSIKVGIASFDDKPASCYHLATPLTVLDKNFILPKDVIGFTSNKLHTTHGHLEGIINTVVDTRIGWSYHHHHQSQNDVNGGQNNNKLIKTIILLTDNIGLSGHENEQKNNNRLSKFDLNKVRINSQQHCAERNYPEYLDVAHVLKKGHTNLIVGLFNPDEISEKVWKWAVQDDKFGLGSANAQVAVIKNKEDGISLLSGAIQKILTCHIGESSLSRLSSPRIENQCQADCDCSESPDCPCCSGFKVLLRLPVEPKDIEVKVTH